MLKHPLTPRRESYSRMAMVGGFLLCWVMGVHASAIAAEPDLENADGYVLAEFDIRAVAEEFGVSFAVARARLEFEGRFLELIAQVAEQVPSYVDSAFDAEFSTASAQVFLANARESDWERAEEILGPLGDAVRIEPARLTEDEADAMLATAWDRVAWLEDEGHVLALSWSVASDRLTVVVGGPAGPPTELDRNKIASAISDLALNIEILDGPESFEEGHAGTCTPAPTQTGGWTEGGRRINPCGAVNNHNCTAGFSVRSVSTPSRTGILTAAHCNDFSNNVNKWWYLPLADGTTPFSTVRYFDHLAYNLGDIMFVREWFASALARPRVYRHGQVWTTITTFQYENPVGTTIVAKGAQTAHELSNHVPANMVGSIVSNQVVTRTNGVLASTNHQYAAADYGSGACCGAELSPRGGDSGSPIWIVANGRALGIHKGGDPRFEMYSKIGYALTDMNLQLLTQDQ